MSRGYSIQLFSLNIGTFTLLIGRSKWVTSGEWIMRAETIELAELVYMASVYRRRKFYSEAINLLTQALSASQSQKDRSTDAIVQYSLARVYQEQGNNFFAKELYDQALSDWLGGKAANPIHQLWSSRTLRSLERACQQLIQQVEQRCEIQDLPLPTMRPTERWLKAG
jgi:tetratricopeptide (TPR) repeat protein